jgi:hypothetical protein
MSPRKKAASVSDRVFVEAWLSSTSVGEVAAKTGLSRGYIHSRAYKVRCKGIKLPTMKRPKTDDVKAINALIEAAKEVQP